jgi:elongation factor P
MYSTTDFRKGLKIEFKDQPWVIIDFKQVSPGKGAAFMKTKMKNLQSQKVLEVTFKTGDKVGIPDIEEREMQYLFNDGANYTFMDNATYDQIALSVEEIGEAKNFIIENSQVHVTFYKNKAVACDVPTFVELAVAETQPNIKGDTSSGGGKPATMETGCSVTVPFHINAGDVLRIDSRTCEYVEKVKK